MSETISHRRVAPAVRVSAELVVAAIVLFYGLRVASLVRYPIGGGEFHLLFAYSEGGRTDVAVGVFLFYVLALLVTSFALRLLGLTASALPTATVASAVFAHAWWSVATWPSASPAFAGMARGLLAAGPILIGITTWAAWSRGLRSSTSTVLSARGRALRRLLGGAIVLAPYGGTALMMTYSARQRAMRAAWLPTPWESVGAIDSVQSFDAAQGLVFAGERARELARQCTRSTPGTIVGTWTPTPEQIMDLEQDLVRYLVRHDTGRTRESGFKMPPFHVYFRQYGGLELVREGKIIYVNALLPGYWTNTAESGSPPAWQREAVDVCGGWQAYFGIEYHPSKRSFRRFSYNPSPTQ